VIELRSVTKKYGDQAAVMDLTLTVSEGEVCILIGPSGCGKSTTIKLVNRMLEPESGEIYVNGRNVRGFKPEFLRRRIGYVIQYVGLFPHMTVSDNIAVVPKLLSWEKGRISNRVDELLHMVGLRPETYRHKYPHELSGGEAQRIGVARALASDPPVLLMDEPFGAVDPLNRESLQAEFMKIQKELKKTVLFVTHDLDEAIRLADKIALMRDGAIVQYDTPENILAHPANRFVHDFVGTDRALKRLSRYSVATIMRRAYSLSMHDYPTTVHEYLKKQPWLRFLWIVGEKGELRGWLDTRDFKEQGAEAEVITEVKDPHFGLSDDSTLRDALSRMLAEGVKVLPVLDRERRVVGEISLKDIERVTEEVTERWSE